MKESLCCIMSSRSAPPNIAFPSHPRGRAGPHPPRQAAVPQQRRRYGEISPPRCCCAPAAPISAAPGPKPGLGRRHGWGAAWSGAAGWGRYLQRAGGGGEGQRPSRAGERGRGGLTDVADASLTLRPKSLPIPPPASPRFSAAPVDPTLLPAILTSRHHAVDRRLPSVRLLGADPQQ